MTQLHTPPELTADGAQLLADVLAKRHTPAPTETGSIEVGPPRRGLPVVIGLVLGAVILGSTAVWIAFDEPVAVEVRGAVEVASETTPTGQSQLTATIDDLSPRNGDVRTFSLRVDAGAIDADIDVDQITVLVENEAGTRALTFVRFDEAALRSESSVMATVRVEGLDAGTSFVAVWVDDLALERIPLG